MGVFSVFIFESSTDLLLVTKDSTLARFLFHVTSVISCSSWALKMPWVVNCPVINLELCEKSQQDPFNPVVSSHFRDLFYNSSLLLPPFSIDVLTHQTVFAALWHF